MRRILMSLSPLLLLAGIACQRPEVEAFKRNPRPVVVACTAPKEVQDREALQQDFAAALRARLATRVEVVPEGVAAPAGAVTVTLEIRSVDPPRYRSSSGAVGISVGVGVGALSAAAGHRDWAWDGLFWGLWASDVASMQESLNYRLGYAPWEIRTIARMTEPNDPEPLAVFAVDTFDTVDALSALPPDASADPDRVREEQAKGFARMVTAKLSEIFEWKEGPPRYFGVKAKEPVPLEPRLSLPKVEPPQSEAPQPMPQPTPEAAPALPEPKPEPSKVEPPAAPPDGKPEPVVPKP
ncbi:MAG TPA: hypothetical protein VJ600_03510 [Holophagaceae bacterium]|nr:hypothetical protein [Holophagaceae bacterium]